MPYRKWLVSAFRDLMTDTDKIERDIEHDITAYKRYSKTQPFPYEIQLNIKWYDLEASNLKPNHRDYSHYLNYSGIIPSLNAEFSSVDDYDGLVLLLDRDLLVRNGHGDLYVSLVKHDFFKPRRNPSYFACCFGDTPCDGMRCAEPSKPEKICAIRAHACSACEPDELLYACNHTCYWFFIGLLLRAYSKPKQVNPQNDEDIRTALPLPYIY